MRFRGLLLSLTESRAVMNEVDAWCRRTGTNYRRLIVAAGLTCSIRSDVRKRQRKLTTMTAKKLRRTMQQYGAGISREQHKAHLDACGDRVTLRRAHGALSVQVQRQVREHVEALRVDRTPCPRCGVRADIGCEHSRRDFERRGGARIITA